MASASVWLLSLFLCWGLPSPHTTLSYAAVYYVTPHTSDPNCSTSGELCLTINEYAQGKYFDGDDNITLLFLNGEHSLTAQDLVIHHKMTLTMAPAYIEFEVIILLANVTVIQLQNILSIELSRLKFISSNNDQASCALAHLSIADIAILSAERVSIESSKLLLQGGMDATLTELNAVDSCIHLLLNQSNQTVAMVNSELELSTLTITDRSTSLASEVLGGIMTNTLSLESSLMHNSLVTVKLQTQVTYKLSLFNNTFVSEGSDSRESGLRVDMENSSTLYLLIKNCTIIGNHRGTYITAANNSKGIVNIGNCMYSHNKEALVFDLTSSQVTITETVVEHNENGIVLDGLPLNGKNVRIDITDSIFQENNGLCLGMKQLRPVSPKIADISLKNVTFSNNINQISLPNAGIVQVDGRISLSIEDSCAFKNNHGSSVQALLTTVTLSGVVVFEDNIAFQGGALLLSLSMIKLKSINLTNTNIIVENNTAIDGGGGISTDHLLSRDFYTGSSCFYDEILGVSLEDIQNSSTNITFTFINNTATKGGNDIFGATPNSHCPIAFQTGNISVVNSSKIHNYIFKTSSNLSSISSDPKRVCLCDSSSQLMCTNLSHIFYETTRSPGEMFSLSLAVVGFEFGMVNGPVYANLLSQANNSQASLGIGQYVREITHNGCTQLNFTVNSMNSKETIVLTVNDNFARKQSNSSSISSVVNEFVNDRDRVIPVELLTVPVYIEVTLLDCPIGFELTTTGTCVCSKALNSIGIHDCFVQENISYITRSGNQWVSLSPDEGGIFYSQYCPLDYCDNRIIRVNLQYPDIQCNFNHTGVLCGGCPSNFSLALGSSKCVQCDNNDNMVLIIPFAAAGILLVLFIKILDMTVTTGTINGLIFYANIIWAFQNVLFPPRAQTSILLAYLKIFIAWLNLDLGLETCFIQHLDAYSKAWLQFAFPAYLWLIVALIIIVSHYSVRATKLFGNNSISVLATLFLLSYVKLPRALLIIQYTVLGTLDGEKNVWSIDGNLEYFSPKGIILFVGALIILLLLWLPCTFSLLLIQILRRHSYRRFLRWVNKLIPLFDSYLGPLKPKHHYWIGLGLLARLFLVFTLTSYSTRAPFLGALLITLVALLFCFLVLSVYRQWQLSVLEGCFLCNMALFASGTLYIEAQGGSKNTLACISLGITFLLFLAIIVYHVWRRIKALVRWLKSRKENSRIINGYDEIHHTETPAQAAPPCQPATCQVISIAKHSLQESLL